MFKLSNEAMHVYTHIRTHTYVDGFLQIHIITDSEMRTNDETTGPF